MVAVRSILGVMAIALLAVAIAVGLAQTDAFGYLDLQLATPKRIPLASRLVLVTIDRDTGAKLGDPPMGGRIRRRHHADFIRDLRKAGAKAVVFDLMFTDVDSDDRYVQRALSESAPLPVVLVAEPDRPERAPGRSEGMEVGFRYPTVLPMMTPPNVTVASPLAWDPDLVVRGIPLIVPDAHLEGSSTPYLALATWLAIRGATVADLHWNRERGGWSYGDRFWPVGRDGNHEIAWIDDGSRMPRLEYGEALRLAASSEGASIFENAVVIVGSITEGARANDVHPTAGGEMSGSEFVANVYNSLDAPPERQVHATTVLSNLVVGLILAIVAASLLKIPRVVAGLFVGVLVVAVLAGVQVGDHSRLFLGACLVLGATLSLLVHGAFRNRWIARVVPSGLRDARWSLKDRPGTVLFVDMKGSTQAVNAMSLDATARMLTRFLSESAEIVHRHGGTVEKTMGDGLLAVFYSTASDHGGRCLAAMAALDERACELRKPFRREYGVELEITMGAEEGLVSGNIVKTRDHEEWSVFGPTIHYAARLQSRCGDHLVTAIIGENLRRRVGPERSRSLGMTELKGFGLREIFNVALSSETPLSD